MLIISNYSMVQKWINTILGCKNQQEILTLITCVWVKPAPTRTAFWVGMCHWCQSADTPIGHSVQRPVNTWDCLTEWGQAPPPQVRREVRPVPHECVCVCMWACAGAQWLPAVLHLSMCVVPVQERDGCWPVLPVLVCVGLVQDRDGCRPVLTAHWWLSISIIEICPGSPSKKHGKIIRKLLKCSFSKTETPLSHPCPKKWNLIPVYTVYVQLCL